MKFKLHTATYSWSDLSSDKERTLYAELGFKRTRIGLIDPDHAPIVELSSMEELMEFRKKCGCDLILGKDSIWLYDDYME